MNPRNAYLFLALTLIGSTAIAACGGQATGTIEAADGGASPPTATGTGTGASPEPPKEPVVCTQDKACRVSFLRDVEPILESSGEGKCAQAGCHRPSDATNPALSDGDVIGNWKALTSYRGPLGRAYVVPCMETAAEGAMGCNLGGDPSCGKPMPIGRRLSAESRALIEGWLACGAPLN